MVKKIYDIIPPSEKKKERLAASVKIEPFKEKKSAERASGKDLKWFSKSLAIFLIFLLILTGIFGFFFFSKSKIYIWPKIETLSLESKVTVSLEQKETDPALWTERAMIPAKTFNDQKTGAQDFSATGTTLKEAKAEGIIRVYNNYSTQEQPLLAQTRFVSSDGKMFRTIQREVLAGGRQEGGKFIAGETDIKVSAAEPGEDYNIGPSTFSIPGFAGTPKYTAFYGKSFSNMSGGFKGEKARVSQEDLDRAREVLGERLKKESRESLQSSLPEGFILLDGALFQEITEENYSEETGSGADSFNFQAKVKSTGLVFERGDIEKFARGLINFNIEEGRKLQEESLEINYSSELVDLNAGKMVLNLEIKAKVYSDINLEEVKKAVLGKSSQEVRIYLEDQTEIIKTEINLGPFWRRKIPENMDKVEIKLEL